MSEIIEINNEAKLLATKIAKDLSLTEEELEESFEKLENLYNSKDSKGISPSLQINLGTKFLKKEKKHKKIYFF